MVVETEGGSKDRDEPDDTDPPRPREDGKRSNTAPDAVKDPSEKTDGMPGVPAQGDETDPGSG